MMNGPALGSCFGFGIRSSLRFAYLRSGDGGALTVEESRNGDAEAAGELVREWRMASFHARLFSDGSLYRLWTNKTGWFTIEPHQARIVVPPSDDELRREERLWGVPAVLCFLVRGDVPLHAAAVELDAGAVLLAAPSAFGKTTLAAAFLRAGYRVLAEDLACLRLTGEPRIFPGPAMLRVRRDVADRLDLPYAEKLGETEDRVHLAIAPDQRGDGAPVPVRGVVFLRPAAEGGSALERVDAGDAIRDLWVLSFRLAGTDEAARSFKGVTDLARLVPVWNLSHPLRFGLLERAVERIEAGVTA
jgi:hypothetical protein